MTVAKTDRLSRMATPPGVSAEAFAAAIAQFKTMVGEEWVFTADEDVALYRDAYSPYWGESEERVASAAVAPSTVEQVQAIVRTANQYKIPLYAISTGRNLAYGGPAPVYSGSVVLDLKRMNRILEVNERNAYALVEPGVSYFDLYRYIREHKLKVWIDCPDPGWGSLVGNALDHGGGYTPYRDHFDAHCGMEVVLADGDIMRTGMGAVPSAKTWQQFKYGLGPIVDGLFGQSNFGIVTKMGFWLMPEPEAYLRVNVTVPRHDDIIPFIDIMSNLMYSGVINTQARIFSPVFHGVQAPEVTAMLTKPGGTSAEEFNRYAARRNLKFWTTRFTFHGPQKVIAAQWEHVKDSFSAIPGAEFEEAESLRFPLADAQIPKTDEPAPLGIPSLQIFGMGISTTDAQANAAYQGHMDFSPVIPMTGEAILEIIRVFTKVFVEMGVRPRVGWPQCYHPRTLIVIHGFSISRDPEENRKNREAFARLIEVAAEHGWALYRAHAIVQDKAVEQYSFNNHALLRFQEAIKDAIDPNGIISPGRYGIWPKHLRRGRS